MTDRAASAATPLPQIRVRGARVHNLQNVDVDLPRDRLIVFTGLSGSGKSSLAFDTIFAEGQRRYVESLSSYARMFLDQVDRPDVDLIEGLSPAVSIDQRSTSRNPRSTVGTITEISDYLRLLWARVGVPHCPTCGARVQRQTVQQIADEILMLPAGTRFHLLAPVVDGQRGTHADLLSSLIADGFSRAMIDGDVVQLSSAPTLAKQAKHSISVVVDRLVSGPDLRERLTDSLEIALRLADGIAVVDFVGDDSPSPRTFSEHLSCPNLHPLSLTTLEPRTFSFNAPFGACSVCSGLGTRQAIDPFLLLGDPDLTLAEGVLLPWAQAGGSAARYFQGFLAAFAEAREFSMMTPWRDLPTEIQQAVLHDTTTPVRIRRSNRFGRDLSYTSTYEGVAVYLERRYNEADTDAQRERYGRYLREVPCAACNGQRLRPEVLAVRINERSIADATELNLVELNRFLASLDLDDNERAISALVLREIQVRVQFLLDVGLHYLTLARGAATLSGGEAQRIRLATQVGTGLTGVLYVLDEPSIGLHQRDNDRLLATLIKLRDLGNTLVVVEHDEDTIRAADWIVDVGPGAGSAGGTIVHSGDYPGLLRQHDSITGDYLAGRRSIDVPATRRAIDPDRLLSVVGARANNLKNVTVTFPLGVFVAVTGVSGSGKSSLVNEILQKVLANALNGARHVPGSHIRVTGLEHLDKVVYVDQSPIGRTPRSNPATYSGVFDRIRNLFADTTEAKARGYSAARFSFNVKGGRCETCAGDGTLRIEMNFLPDVFVACEVCHGARYNRETLQITYKSKTIAEVLDMPIATAADFFRPFTMISRYLDALVGVGLGYVRLGQSSTTLSGGEAQRVKLAAELQRRSKGRTVYVLDEPTTGLHFEDVRVLLQVLNGLVEKGNSVITIEHNLDVIKTADWVIDMGPEGGDGGGSVVAAGTPEDVSRVRPSWTGQHLRAVLAREAQRITSN